MKSSILTLGALFLAIPLVADDNQGPERTKVVRVTTPVKAIWNGIDVWETPPGHSTFVSFEHDPIPAGFFCSGSEPFTGTIFLGGTPVQTHPPDALGRADTIIQRLDDAFFDKNGIAETRIQVRALSLSSTEPIETTCGSFNVKATLTAGEQPVTTMRIVRQRPDGGYFLASLELDVKLVFTTLDGELGEHLEIVENIRFDQVRIPWTDPDSRLNPDRPRLIGVSIVLVDTDGDGEPDTFLPGTTNLGRPSRAPVTKSHAPICEFDPPSCACHYESGKHHCTLL